jgi:hypothetical protein
LPTGSDTRFLLRPQNVVTSRKTLFDERSI